MRFCTHLSLLNHASELGARQRRTTRAFFFGHVFQTQSALAPIRSSMSSRPTSTTRRSRSVCCVPASPTACLVPVCRRAGAPSGCLSTGRQRTSTHVHTHFRKEKNCQENCQHSRDLSARSWLNLRSHTKSLLVKKTTFQINWLYIGIANGTPIPAQWTCRRRCRYRLITTQGFTYPGPYLLRATTT